MRTGAPLAETRCGFRSANTQHGTTANGLPSASAVSKTESVAWSGCIATSADAARTAAAIVCFFVFSATSATSALQQDDALAHASKVSQQYQIVVIENLGAHRHLYGAAVAAGTRPHLSHAVATGFGLEVLLVAEIDKGIEAIDRFDNDIASAPSITAVWATIFNMCFTPEANATGTAVTAFDEYFCGIEKLHCPVIRFADLQTCLSPVRQNEA